MAGRPKIDIDLEAVERLAGQGLSQEQIADCLGICRDTLQRRKREYSTFSTAIRRGQARGIEQVTNALFEQSQQGNVAASIFYLKNRAGWRDKQEITGEGGSALVVQVVKHSKEK